MYDPAAFADKLEKWEEKFWENIDSWLLEMIDENEMGMVATTTINLLRTGNRTTSKLLSGTAADLLRLGTFDPDDASAWGITKGIGANALRLISIVGPVGRVVSFSGRFAGLVGASKLKNIPNTTEPCTFVAANNVASLLTGRTQQIFGSVDDIIAHVRPASGWTNREVVKLPQVRALFDKHGIFTKNVFGVQSVDDVMNVARRSEGPITFGIEWTENGNLVGHELTVVKDAFGKLKILDYFEGNVKGFRGYDSFQAWARSFRSGRPARGGVTLDTGPVLHNSSQELTLLKIIDDKFVFGLPFVLGIRPNGAAFDIGRSLWDYLSNLFGNDMPDDLPDLTTNPNEWTRTIIGKPPYWYTVRQGVPKEDWISSRAGKEYGDPLLWPLIYEATRLEEIKTGSIKFVNQNKMWAGQRVFVPEISGLPPEKILAAKNRGRDWKRVG